MAIVKNSVRSPAAQREDPTVESLRSIVSKLVATGSPSLPAAAREAGVSVRTLQRHLASAGVTYSELALEVRLNRARELLGDRSRQVEDIASLLGYADAANFTRAFKKWAGVTPSRYRKSLAGPPPS